MKVPFHGATSSARIVVSIPLLGGVFAAVVPERADAALLTLIDGNSSADFDTAAAANNYNWFVDGNDKLAQQAFWYRIGNAGPESSVHTLPIGLQGTSDANFNGNPDTLFVRYNGAGFTIETTYTLNGGTPGSGASDMGELITIKNTGASPLDFHFFQYADFDLSAADTIVFTNANAVQQAGGTRLTETIITPVPSHREAAFFPTTLNKLNDGLATTLSDTPALNSPIGPGDVTWAFQWDVSIPVGGTFQISKDKNLAVPEPGTIALVAIGASLLATRRRRRA